MKRSQPSPDDRPIHLSIPKGSKRWIGRRFTAANGVSFVVTIGVVRGSRPGPVFANVAGQHGMEHVGPVVLRRIFDQINPRQMAGVLYLCPGANPLALENDFEAYPERINASLCRNITSFESLGIRTREQLGEYNMNRLWGDDIADQPPEPLQSPRGRGEGVAQRVARWLWKTMIAPAEVVVDHHCVKQTISPYMFCDEPSIPWTPFIGMQGVWSTGPLPKPPTPYVWRRLALQSIRHGKVGIVIEYSHQHTIEERDIPAGLFAVTNMMRALRMIPGKPKIICPVWELKGPYFKHYRTINSKRIGHVQYLADEYTLVRRGQPVARIVDLQTNRVVQTLRSPVRGLMLHHNPKAVVRPGDWVSRVTPKYRLLAAPGKPYPVPPLPELASAD